MISSACQSLCEPVLEQNWIPPSTYTPSVAVDTLAGYYTDYDVPTDKGLPIFFIPFYILAAWPAILAFVGTIVVFIFRCCCVSAGSCDICPGTWDVRKTKRLLVLAICLPGVLILGLLIGVHDLQNTVDGLVSVAGEISSGLAEIEAGITLLDKDVSCGSASFPLAHESFPAFSNVSTDVNNIKSHLQAFGHSSITGVAWLFIWIVWLGLTPTMILSFQRMNKVMHTRNPNRNQRSGKCANCARTMGSCILVTTLFILACFLGFLFSGSVLVATKVCDPSPQVALPRFLDELNTADVNQSSSQINSSLPWLKYYFTCQKDNIPNPLVFADAQDCHLGEGGDVDQPVRFDDGQCANCSCTPGPLLDACANIFDVLENQTAVCTPDQRQNLVSSTVGKLASIDGSSCANPHFSSAILQTLEQNVCGRSNSLIAGFYSWWSWTAAVCVFVFLIFFIEPIALTHIEHLDTQNQQNPQNLVPTIAVAVDGNRPVPMALAVEPGSLDQPLLAAQSQPMQRAVCQPMQHVEISQQRPSERDTTYGRYEPMPNPIKS